MVGIEILITGAAGGRESPAAEGSGRVAAGALGREIFGRGHAANDESRGVGRGAADGPSGGESVKSGVEMRGAMG